MILPRVNKENHEQNKFVESTSVPGQVGVTTVNPDGTNIGDSLKELIVVIRNFLFVLVNPPYIDKSANAIRNQVQSGTITTVTTVTNLTNLTNFGSMPADVTYRINSNNMWANVCRRLIT
jgi:hypothetical protein